MNRMPRVDAVLVQAVIAGALSFAHLHDIAAAAGQDGWKAWAYPVSVDLLLVASWRRIRSLKAVGEPCGLAWCWFVVALAASLGANVATAGLLDLDAVPAWLRILVAGWPALAFFGGTLLAHSPTGERESAPSTELGRAESEEESPAPADALDRLELPEAEATPAPVEPSPPALALDVPPALITHARKLADAHQAQTGGPIDTDTLRARLGVPAPMADAIATQLT